MFVRKFIDMAELLDLASANQIALLSRFIERQESNSQNTTKKDVGDEDRG